MAPAPKSPQQTFQELWELLRSYAQQETFGPLKNLKRRLGFGILGSFSIALGIFLLDLGMLRGLQTHDLPTSLPLLGHTFRDHDWAPYFLACLVLAIVIAVMGYRIAKPKNAADGAVASKATAGSSDARKGSK